MWKTQSNSICHLWCIRIDKYYEILWMLGKLDSNVISAWLSKTSRYLHHAHLIHLAWRHSYQNHTHDHDQIWQMLMQFSDVPRSLVLRYFALSILVVCLEHRVLVSVGRSLVQSMTFVTRPKSLEWDNTSSLKRDTSQRSHNPKHFTK